MAHYLTNNNWNAFKQLSLIEWCRYYSVLPMVRLLRCDGSLKYDPITKNTVLSSLSIRKLIVIKY